MRNYKIKWGNFLFVRWIIISWLFQAVHVLDRGEKIFRIWIEFLPLLIILILFYFNVISTTLTVTLIFVLHTIFWLCDSTWLVGFREVNHKFKGKGIQSIVDFVEFTKKELADSTNITFIAIYGSICRHKYHDRSDFDLRIVQNKPSWHTYFKMIKLRFVAIWKYRIPIDLKLVDTVSYLKKEMREDEHPILAYKTSDFENEGDSYDYFVNHLSEYLKN